MKNLIKTELSCCPHCLSPDIQQLQYCGVNDAHIDASDHDAQCWCKNCEEHFSLDEARDVDFVPLTAARDIAGDAESVLSENISDLEGIGCEEAAADLKRVLDFVRSIYPHTTHYLLEMEGDVEPVLHLCQDEQDRDEKARNIRTQTDENGLYKIDASGPIQIETFSGSFFD